MSSDLQLGLTPWRMQKTFDANTLCEQAELAEQWGYSSFFLPENHFSGSAPIPDPMLLLAAIAARTSTLLLGTSSYLLPIRNALLAAEQVASLDHLCGGRLILGLGRGYQPGMLEAFGVTNSDKRERFSKNLEAMLAAWRGETVGGAEHAQTLAPLPLQQPHPPLWVAAFGPKAIAQVGRLGLPYLASPMESLAELRDNYRRHAEALAEHQHTAPDTVAIMRTVFVSEDAKSCQLVRDKLAALPAAPLRDGPAPAVDDWCLLGSAAEVQQRLHDYRQALGLTHLIAVRPRVSGIESTSLAESFASFSQLTPA
ncbi:MAG: LLM class flavin-dependent oxidoreductase [Halieaceae bacterium]